MLGSKQAWVIVATVTLAACGTLLGLGLSHDPGHGHYSAWGSSLAISAYALFAIGATALICVARDIHFPFGRKPYREGVMIISSAPGDLRAETVGNGFQRQRLRDIFGKFRNVNAAEARRRVDPYLNKWIQVTGGIHDVDVLTGGQVVVLIRSGSRDPNVRMVFSDRAAFGPLEILPRGALVTALGRVTSIEQRQITTADSEIVSYPR
jgi:hypothetical protein